MGCSPSKHLGTERRNKEARKSIQYSSHKESRELADGPDFLHPYRDPKSIDDYHTFPLDGQDIASVSDKQLLHAYSTAPRLHHYSGIMITRISKSMVIKGGLSIAKSESENMILASETLHLPVPKVHRTFTANIPDILETKEASGHFIVMDYIAGPTVEECWHSLDRDSRESVARQVADIIEKMQSRHPNDLPIGPLGRGRDQKFEGPFRTLGDLEAWCNHKIDVCVQVHQLPAGTPRFQFQDVVFTHQDISPRNLVLDENKKVWIIDWGCAGVYPRGFEQAVLRLQSSNDDFADMVLARLSDQQKEMTEQYAGITYGLSTGRLL
ncbi:kinase-like domain-containing protein [Biscogniauxia marginata]|nr:kinase-like domain-containing protein [Biscogniauxia marginata]